MGGFAFASFVGRQTRFVLKPAPLFFDLDHTLWDFESNSRHALRAGFEEVGLKRLGIENPEGWIEAYEAANEWCWAEFRHGRMDKETLRAERFRLAMERVGVTPSPAVAEQLGEHYIATSPHQTALMEGTHEVLEALLDRGHDMWLLTNGFEEVQHLKVARSGLEKYFHDVFTSDALGVKKPDPRAFHGALDRAGLKATAPAIMVGDSLESDVLGAQNVGWKAIHFNPEGPQAPEAWRTVRRLVEVLDLPLKG